MAEAQLLRNTGAYQNQTYLPHAVPGACPENGHPDRGHPPEQGIWSPQAWLPFP